MPDEAKRAINTFLAQDSEAEEASAEAAAPAPEANAYEFQSHGVIDMLEKLLDKFLDERTELEKEEMNGQHAFEMLVGDLRMQITQAEEDRERKMAAKAKTLQAKADAEGDLADTKATLAEDE